MDKTADAPPSPWLRAPDVLDRLHISSTTLKRLRAEGKLTEYRLGGLVRFHVDDVDGLLQPKRSDVA